MAYDAGQVEIAVVLDEVMTAGGQEQLIFAVRRGVGIDPNEIAVGDADAKRKLFLGRFGQDSINDVCGQAYKTP